MATIRLGSSDTDRGALFYIFEKTSAGFDACQADPDKGWLESRDLTAN